MSPSEKIICKPTPWFLLRAGVIFAMFSFFSVWFYFDGTTGYRQKNYEFYVHATFKPATDIFAKMNSESPLTEETWREFAANQTVDFPEDRSVLPADLKLPMAWPEELMDFNQVKSLQHNHLWRAYSGKHKYNEEPAEKPYDSEKIQQQIYVCYICVGLSAIALFFLLRTIRRSIIVDDLSLTTADGKNIPFESMRVLDLRKWASKGLAFIEYEAPSGKNRARIDGLTYGGFNHEKNQPAEQLLRRIRSHFTGEIVDYGEERGEE